MLHYIVPKADNSAESGAKALPRQIQALQRPEFARLVAGFTEDIGRFLVGGDCPLG